MNNFKGLYFIKLEQERRENRIALFIFLGFVLCVFLAARLTCPMDAANAELIAGHAVDEYVDAIYKAEGGPRAAYLYGIRSVKYDSPGEARKICENSVRNNYKRWVAAGSPGDFIDFMGARYCPPTAHELNKNWAGNVRSLLK